jgi:hypothetical protein
MRIQSSQIALSAEQSRTLSSATQVTGRVWADSPITGDAVRISDAARAQLTSVAVTTSTTQAQGRILVSAAQSRNNAPAHARDLTESMSRSTKGLDNGTQTNASSGDNSEINEVSDDELLGTTNGSQMIVLKRLVEAMTGQKIRVVSAKDLQSKGDETSSESSGNATPQNAETSNGAGRVGWGVELNVETSRTETRSSDFTAQGNLVTADGRTLEFSASFLKESQSVSVEQIRIREGDAKLKDPLVLLYSGSTAELSAKTASFDLDDNGTLDNLPGLSNGAYVVADRNNDGKVNDATELLGALSNDGFSDLRAMDGDGNGFVDEGDVAFGNLYLWDPTAAPQAQLTSLAKAGVGALYTGQVASPFDLRGDTGTLQGRVRATGIYVTESGTVRPMEQLDLVQNGEAVATTAPAPPPPLDVKA